MANSKFWILPNGERAVSTVPVDPATGLPVVGTTGKSDIDIILGKVPGVSAISVSGVHLNILDLNTHIVEELDTVLVTSAAGETMTVRSTSALDVGDVVLIDALGANYQKLAPVAVTLNGTTPITIPGGPLTRINSVVRISGDLSGNCLIESSGQVRGFILAGQQLQRKCAFTVPANYKLVIRDIVGSLTKDTGNNVSCVFGLVAKPTASSTFGPLLAWSVTRDGASYSEISQGTGPGITGPFDINVSVVASVTGVSVQSYLSCLLIDLSQV